ncbi:dienelactone hydrolase [Thelephora terrestris]|uniref:Dienelactone hydrolase n=1 Tax=Thelephora terrestris TaxID=56493 RepID=A0A9P6L7H9_9AGAM|nr:dienelactone hydrolase [Thelephora terrestris]
MTTVHNPNKACCSIPPVQAEYTAKGTYKSHGAFDRAYVTGDNSETALIIVYDIFGYFPQTLQGADILAKTLGVQVFMPDFFGEGNTFDIKKFPPKTDQDKKDIQDFFGGVGSPPPAATRLVDFAHGLKREGFKKIGALGYCWGGKVVIMGALTEGNPLDAISIVHPAMISSKDAEGLSVPSGIYFSKDESREEFDKIVDVLSKKSFSAKVDSKYYSNMFHGWAAARGNLSDPENKREYEDLYSRAAAFFTNALALV